MTIDKGVLRTIAHQQSHESTLQRTQALEEGVPEDIRRCIYAKLSDEDYVGKMMAVFELQFPASARFGRHKMIVHSAPLHNSKQKLELVLLARALMEVCDPLIEARFDGGELWADLTAQW